MVQICIILLESCTNASNLHSITLNLVLIHRIFIRMVRIPFEWFEFSFDCFEFRSNCSNCSNLHSNGLNLQGIGRILFECFEFAFDYFESRSNASNLHSNG